MSKYAEAALSRLVHRCPIHVGLCYCVYVFYTGVRRIAEHKILLRMKLFEDINKESTKRKSYHRWKHKNVLFTITAVIFLTWWENCYNYMIKQICGRRPNCPISADQKKGGKIEEGGERESEAIPMYPIRPFFINKPLNKPGSLN